MTVFGFTLLRIRLMSVALDRYAQTEGLYSADAADAELAQARSKSLSGVLLYGVAIVMGLVLPGRRSGVFRDRAFFGDPMAPRRADAATPAHGIPMNTCRRR